MVFYTSLLPTEIWFHIYKIEHTQCLQNVLNEIKTISQEMRMATLGAEEIIQRAPHNDMVMNILDLTNDDHYEYELLEYISKVCSEQRDGEQKSRYNRVNIWDFKGFLKVTRYINVDQRLTYKRLVLMGRYLYDGPLYGHSGLSDKHLKRKTINQEIMLLRDWSTSTGYGEPNARDELWRNLNCAWRWGYMEGIGWNMIEIYRHLRRTVGKQNPTESDMFVKCLDMLHPQLPIPVLV